MTGRETGRENKNINPTKNYFHIKRKFIFVYRKMLIISSVSDFERPRFPHFLVNIEKKKHLIAVPYAYIRVFIMTHFNTKPKNLINNFLMLFTIHEILVCEITNEITKIIE